MDPPPPPALGATCTLEGAHLAQCNYLGVWPYYRHILCDTRGIIVV